MNRERREFTTRFAGDTESQSRDGGGERTDQPMGMACPVRSRFYRWRKRNGILLKLFSSPAQLQQDHGVNLNVVPSQELPQIHAISPPSLRVSVVNPPLLYGTLLDGRL